MEAGQQASPLLMQRGSNREILSRCRADQLELIIDFLTRTTDLQQRHTERLRATKA